MIIYNSIAGIWTAIERVCHTPSEYYIYFLKYVNNSHGIFKFIMQIGPNKLAG